MPGSIGLLPVPGLSAGSRSPGRSAGRDMDSKALYGSPRIHQDLLGRGIKVCVNTVAKVMKQENIRAPKSHKKVQTPGPPTQPTDCR